MILYLFSDFLLRVYTVQSNSYGVQIFFKVETQMSLYILQPVKKCKQLHSAASLWISSISTFWYDMLTAFLTRRKLHIGGPMWQYASAGTFLLFVFLHFEKRSEWLYHLIYFLCRCVCFILVFLNNINIKFIFY